jgi:ABC-type molybdate transport system substrate-binding protein
MQARLAVKQGNPLGIERLDDIGAKSARLAQANPEAAAISKLVKERLTETGQWEALAAQTTVFKTTVTEVANDVKVGAVDAGIVWDAMAQQYPDLAFVELPELKAVQSHVALAVLTTSRQPQLAHQVARYLSADDGGLAVYREMGYEAADGDPWEETPELTLYAGSMLRPAIDETIKQFEAREGVRVNRVYNGCGILVAQMKAGQMPDAYFACDAEFMAQVKDLFPQPDSISQNELVILVPKGNPRKIKSLKDLGQEGLRVGIGHEKQCAMGWLTQRTFDEGQVTDVVMKNVAVQSPTGDLLVNQMLAGSLDAAVAYLSNAAGAGDKLDAVRIKGLPCAIATQPYGVSVQSKHKQLAARLKHAILAAESRERFTSQGFGWLAK